MGALQICGFALFALPSFAGAETINLSGISYPASGNIRPNEGTVEIWFRLDADSVEGCYYRLFALEYPPKQIPQFHFSYNDHLGAVRFRLAGNGYFFGLAMQNPYYASATIGMPVKGETPDKPYPRHPSPRKGEWHYTALCWEGDSTQETSVYLDGKLVIPPGKLKASVWDDLTHGRLMGPWGVMSVDEFRISAVCRTAEEIARYWQETEKADSAEPKLAVPQEQLEKEDDEFLAQAEGRPESGFQADRFTLLLDHFTAIQLGETSSQTRAVVISGFHGERGGLIEGPAWKRVRGRFGAAIQLWQKTQTGN